MSVLSMLILISEEEPSHLAKEKQVFNIKQRWDVLSITALAISSILCMQLSSLLIMLSIGNVTTFEVGAMNNKYQLDWGQFRVEV